MSTDAEYMTKRIIKELVGKKIVGAAIDHDEDPAFFGFIMDNDLVVWVNCDAEGNGPGWLEMQ